MSAWLDGERYFGKVQRHGLGVAEWQNQPSALANATKRLANRTIVDAARRASDFKASDKG